MAIFSPKARQGIPAAFIRAERVLPSGSTWSKNRCSSMLRECARATAASFSFHLRGCARPPVSAEVAGSRRSRLTSAHICLSKSAMRFVPKFLPGSCFTGTNRRRAIVRTEGVPGARMTLPRHGGAIALAEVMPRTRFDGFLLRRVLRCLDFCLRGRGSVRLGGCLSLVWTRAGYGCSPQEPSENNGRPAKRNGFHTRTSSWMRSEKPILLLVKI